jgi:hypothetical protein
MIKKVVLILMFSLVTLSQAWADGIVNVTVVGNGTVSGDNGQTCNSGTCSFQAVQGGPFWMGWSIY